MRLEVFKKIITLDQLAEIGQQKRDAKQTVVHCHGCFDVVHPGHIRYLQAAGTHGDVLIVSLTGDDAIEKQDGTRPYIPQAYRAENLAALAFVDYVVIADGPTAEPVIERLKPDLYVKGSEYEHSTHPGLLAEKQLVENCGGRVLFSSGGVVFSSTSIVESLRPREGDPGFDEATRLAANCQRWGVTHQACHDLVNQFEGKKIVVLGDSLCDQYTFCETGDVADEAPMLTLTPTHEQAFLGGAAIIAGHIQALGGQAHLVSTVGHDDASDQLKQTLDHAKVEQTLLPLRQTLPVKQRYLAAEQKLMKVNRGEAEPLDSKAEKRVLQALQDVIEKQQGVDALIVADFGFGTITTPLIEAIIEKLRPQIGLLAGDVSGPRRTLLAMEGFDFLTPTERELRSVAGDFERSLPAVAGELMQKLRVRSLLATMGSGGAVLFHPRDENPSQVDPSKWFEKRLRSDYLPALEPRPLDVVGAGDAMLAAGVLAKTAGANDPQAGYLSALAASIAVSQMGNLPISQADFTQALRRRPELVLPPQQELMG